MIRSVRPLKSYMLRVQTGVSQVGFCRINTVVSADDGHIVARNM